MVVLFWLFCFGCRWQQYAQQHQEVLVPAGVDVEEIAKCTQPSEIDALLVCKVRRGGLLWRYCWPPGSADCLGILLVPAAESLTTVGDVELSVGG